MRERELDCFVTAEAAGDGVRPLHAVAPGATVDAYAAACGFDGEAGQVLLTPGPGGVSGALAGLGTCGGPHAFGHLPGRLPAGTWHLASGFGDPSAAVLGWAMGAYRYGLLKRQPAAAASRLVVPPGCEAALSAARAIWFARDLVNTPANLLGPAELAESAADALRARGAHVIVIAGEELSAGFPALAAVGAGAARAPCVLRAAWQTPQADAAAPLVSVCGKGVCFDSGGYDIKPSAAMLRMKKDMGGAAVALGLACMIIDAGLPVRLELRLGCAENMISATAMRPGDVLRTRAGLAVEVGNTDAEGRLVLCDLLSEAGEGRPDLLLDFATLTGAARVALGPDLPAMFANDDVAAGLFTDAGRDVHDPVWQLPLWDGYNYWLESGVGDLNNVSEKAQAGAIVAALFLQRFVPVGTRWAHFDVYAWNDASRPGRPAGGEAQAMRAAFEGVKRFATRSQ